MTIWEHSKCENTGTQYSSVIKKGGTTENVAVNELGDPGANCFGKPEEEEESRAFFFLVYVKIKNVTYSDLVCVDHQ